MNVTKESVLQSTLIEKDDHEMFFYELVACAMKLPPRLPTTSWAGHIPFLYLLIRLLAPRVFVELGVHYGASFIAACDGASRDQLSCRLYGVDTWKGDPNTGFYDGSEIFSSLSNYLAARFPTAELIRSTFTEARERFSAGSIDLLHIDGQHSYEAVRADFETWKDALSDRATVLFHDTYVRERGFGVARYWTELKAEFQTIEFYHCHGLGVLLYGAAAPQPLARLMGLLKGNTEFAEMFRALYEQAGASLARRTFDAEQGQAYPAWEAFKSNVLREVESLKEENAGLRQKLAAAGIQS